MQFVTVNECFPYQVIPIYRNNIKEQFKVNKKSIKNLQVGTFAIGRYLWVA